MKQTIAQIDRDTVFVAHIGEEDASYAYSVGKRTNFVFVALIAADKPLTTSIDIRLVGEHSTATCVGIIQGNKQADIHVHTLQHHEAPNTTSNLLVKSVLTDRASLSYSGSILVDELAQKTDAYQRNENLLLSHESHAQSEPALEIKANDVRCTHGATIASINNEELWYLMSRGIEREYASDMIAEGFLHSALVVITDLKKRATIASDIFGK